MEAQAIPFYERWLIKAVQLGFSFTQDPKAPGSRGGKFYRTDEGHVRYGEKPAPVEAGFSPQAKENVKRQSVMAQPYAAEARRLMHERYGEKPASDLRTVTASANPNEIGEQRVTIDDVPTIIRPGSPGDPFKYQSWFHVNGPPDKDGYPEGARKIHAATEDKYRRQIAEWRQYGDAGPPAVVQPASQLAPAAAPVVQSAPEEISDRAWEAHREAAEKAIADTMSLPPVLRAKIKARLAADGTPATRRILREIEAREAAATKPTPTVANTAPAAKAAPTTPETGDLPDPKGAAKLRAAADAIQESIDNDRDPSISHQNVTARRSRIAAGMFERSQTAEQLQGTIRRLADELEAGTLPPALRGLKNKAQVEQLFTICRLVSAYAKTPQQAAAYRRYPALHFDRRQLQGLYTIANFLKLPGRAEVKKAANSLVQDDYGASVPSLERLAAVEAVARAVIEKAKGGKLERKYPEAYAKETGEYWADSNVRDARALLDGNQRWHRAQAMGLKDQGQWDTAITELMARVPGESETSAEKRLRDAERGLIGMKIPGYFPTPGVIGDRLVELAGIEPGMQVLEPSAGKGNLIEAIARAHPDVAVDAIEQSGTLRNVLELKHANLVGYDFTEHTAGGYDRIVMNPPFENGQDGEHVQHAFELLAPGGRLVSIMSPHAFFASDAKAQAFRSWFDAQGGIMEKLPDKSFMSSERPTGVSTVVVVIDK